MDQHDGLVAELAQLGFKIGDLVETHSLYVVIGLTRQGHNKDGSVRPPAIQVRSTKDGSVRNLMPSMLTLVQRAGEEGDR